MATSTSAATVDAETSGVRKAFRRLVPLLMLFYILAFIDRVNIGFAALSMNADLGLTATMFGFSATMFYIMYSVFEVPSNMALARYGARIWLPRIMITWGLASAATMFAVGPYSLYALRALVGIAEAGLLPGALYYIGLWFPKQYRARANGIFLAGLPVALTIGAPISGLILLMDGIWGLRGWQWLFLLEGLPSVLVGIAAFWLLPNGPADAKWLTDEEKQAIKSALEKENDALKAADAAHPRKFTSIWHELRSIKVVTLSVAYFCLVVSLNTLAIWLPQIVRDAIGGTSHVVAIMFMSAVPPLVAVIVMAFFSIHSDRKKERIWHTIAAFGLAASGWVVCASFKIPTVGMIGLCLAAAGTYAATTTFWTMVSQSLTNRAQAVGIAAVSTFGMIGGIVTPTIVGFLRDMSGAFTIGMWYAAGMLAFAVVVLVVMNTVRRANMP